MRRVSWSLVLAAAGVLGACQSQDSTKLVVTVWSDLAIPTEMDSIHLDIKGSGATHPFDFKLTSKTQLPVQIALVPLGAKDEAFSVRATAQLGGAPVVWQDAYTAFLPNQARELTLFLGHACIGTTTCGAGLTCSNGACTQPIQVDPKSLPTYVPNRPPVYPDAAAVAFDGSTGLPDTSFGETAASGPEGGLDQGGGSALDALADLARSLDGTRQTEGEVGSSSDIPADAPTDGATAKDSPTDLAQDAPAADAPVDAAPDSAVDAPGDASCTPACSLGGKRCGSGGGLQTCGLVNGCAGWSPETACTGLRSCTIGATGAACTCKAAPTGCSAGTGSFCSTTDGSLQTCLQDTDGCVYLGAPTICPAQKPCTGSFPTANCSCPPAPTICSNTTGAFCDGSGSVVTCSHDTQGCLVSAPSKTCPTGKPCGGTAGNADCTCPVVAACASPNPTAGSYCSSNDVVTCSADANGCAQSAVTTCPVGKPCAATTSGSASCTCPAPPAACMNAGTFIPGTSCDSQGQLVTCAIDPVSGCQAATTTVGCPSPKSCQGAQGSAACTCPSVPECSGATQINGNYCSGTNLIKCADNNGCQQSTTVSCASGGTLVCAGTYPTAACAGEQTIGSYADQGMQGNQSTGVLVGWAITVTATATLERFGVIFKGTTTDRHATFALYTNNATTSDPDTLVAASVDRTLSTANSGRNEFAVTSPPASVKLDPGTYWLMISVNLNSTTLGRGAATVQDRYFTQIWGNPLPNPAPIPTLITSGTSQEVNVYIVVLPQ